MRVLNLVTFNIRCFGFNGDYFAPQKHESRLNSLKNFIEINYIDTDIFIFQEIIELSILTKILPNGFKIYHYNHDYNRHMNVVLACKKDFDFMDVQIIPNTALDTTKSRPVIYGKLTQNNKAIAHIIGLHLKSGFEHTDKRIFQCEIINEFITDLDTAIPLVIGGDFNSHFKAKTKKVEDDMFYIKGVFENNLTLADHNQKTYIMPTEDAHLDHFMIQRASINSVEVYSVEKYAETNSLKKYYNEISDHLPVKIKISF